MAEKSPLVLVEGAIGQLPLGDSLEGVNDSFSVVAGSGLVGGGDLATGTKRLDVALAASPSGIIFVGDKIGLDGSDQVAGDLALASGNASLAHADVALSSGNAALTDANTALASGNAALEVVSDFLFEYAQDFTAASTVASGYAVGLDDTGRVQTVRDVPDGGDRTLGSAFVFETGDTNDITSVYDSSNDRLVEVYYDNSNSQYGTAVVGTISGTTITFGTPVVFRSAATASVVSVFDSTNNKVVVSYSDTNDDGTAQVGTVSGSTISFGSAVVFETGRALDQAITYDSSNDRVVIFYSDFANNFGYGTACVGQVSGTTISFGTPVVWESFTITGVSAAFDSNSNKVVATYRKNPSLYGTGVVGTVSGSSISFGASTTFDTLQSTQHHLTFDSNVNKFVNAYTGDAGGPNYGRVVVATVSGTSLTYGTPVDYRTDATRGPSASFEPSTNKVLIAFRDESDSNIGKYVVGTVSGTSMTFGSETTFASGLNYIWTTYDSTSERIVISYDDVDDSSKGYAKVTVANPACQPTRSSVNNFIGIAQSTVESGSNVKVLFPRGIDHNQSGLSTGSFYYVDPTTSGFTTTATEPSTWVSGYPWAPVAKAISSSGLLLLNPM